MLVAYDVRRFDFIILFKLVQLSPIVVKKFFPPKEYV